MIDLQRVPRIEDGGFIWVVDLETPSQRRCPHCNNWGPQFGTVGWTGYDRPSRFMRTQSCGRKYHDVCRQLLFSYSRVAGNKYDSLAILADFQGRIYRQGQTKTPRAFIIADPNFPGDKAALEIKARRASEDLLLHCARNVVDLKMWDEAWEKAQRLLRSGGQG